MHICEWRHMKHPDSNIICTREYIPTQYELALFIKAVMCIVLMHWDNSRVLTSFERS